MRWLGTAAPAAGEEVHVNVVDDLPPLGTAVHSEPVAALGEARRFAQRLRGETNHIVAPDGNASEVQAIDPEERQPREARIHVVPQGVSPAFRHAAPRLGSAPASQRLLRPYPQLWGPCRPR